MKIYGIILGGKFEVNPGLEAKTLFEDLQRSCLGRFSYGSYGPYSAESRYDAAVEEYQRCMAAKRKRPMVYAIGLKFKTLIQQ